MIYQLNSNERDGRILPASSEDDVFVCTLRTLGSKRPTNVRLPPHGASGKRAGNLIPVVQICSNSEQFKHAYK